MEIFSKKLNLIVNGIRYQIDLDNTKKSKYLDDIINKNTFIGVEMKKEKNLDIELKPIFFSERSINIIINYLKNGKFIFDSNNFELFIDIVLCAQYLQMNTLILEIRSYFMNILKNIHNIFVLSKDSSDNFGFAVNI
jgi:hypothetical protein